MSNKTNMGLDMYVGVVKKKPTEEYVPSPSMYWRKFNALHRYFVENIQNCDDDCREHVVPLSILQDLKERLTTIRENKPKVITTKHNEGLSEDGDKYLDEWYTFEPPTKKQIKLYEELLATQAGFFFGGTGYDEYYLNNIKSTLNWVKDAIEYEEFFEYYYSSSR